MTRLLAIETASAACSAALWIDGEVEERHALAPRQHASLILPMIESLLVEADLAPGDLDACAFGRGPGSFTGVRIAASVIQGIAFAADLPVVPVSSLAALAGGCVRETGIPHILAALDARRGEVYWGRYRSSADGGVIADGDEQVCAPQDAALPVDGDWAGAGSGWIAHGEVLTARAGERLVRVMPDLEPRAQDVATLAARDYLAGGAVDAAAAIPVYLRNKVADEPKVR
ncbi:MAG: tRNA (adenosine(37)-N6)-threonylcarbamoyltransferase complex dimerization subunit type 1 TsaB [Thiohalobacterales bacterium]|nr:tRNA (adenosine(37)-N6)-threonylcarbamoyltransferase complex dimerization subunit type 1 TsaB [Thiohalobacterales bacterium]